MSHNSLRLMEHRRTLFSSDVICDAAPLPHSCRLISPVPDWLRQCIGSRRDSDWVHYPWSKIQGSVSVAQMGSVLNGTGGCVQFQSYCATVMIFSGLRTTSLSPSFFNNLTLQSGP